MSSCPSSDWCLIAHLTTGRLGQDWGGGGSLMAVQTGGRASVGSQSPEPAPPFGSTSASCGDQSPIAWVREGRPSIHFQLRVLASSCWAQNRPCSTRVHFTLNGLCSQVCFSSDFVASRKLSGRVWKIRDRKEPTLRTVGASVGGRAGNRVEGA